MKQAFSWWAFAGKVESPALLAKQAAEIGYHGAELVQPEWFGSVIDAGLELTSHSGHGTLTSGLNDPANHDRIMAELESNLELAVQY